MNGTQNTSKKTHKTGKREAVCASKSKPHHLLIREETSSFPSSPQHARQSLSLPRNRLPTLVTYTNDPFLAVAASNMPAELVLW